MGCPPLLLFAPAEPGPGSVRNLPADGAGRARPARGGDGATAGSSWLQRGDEEPEWLQAFLLLLFRSLRRHPPLLLDTVKNFCDILNPLDQLGICRSNPGVIGLGGLVSSLAGIVIVACPQLKLKTQ